MVSWRFQKTESHQKASELRLSSMKAADFLVSQEV